jgi:hypothetical protein
VQRAREVYRVAIGQTDDDFVIDEAQTRELRREA